MSSSLANLRMGSGPSPMQSMPLGSPHGSTAYVIQYTLRVEAHLYTKVWKLDEGFQWMCMKLQESISGSVFSRLKSNGI